MNDTHKTSSFTIALFSIYLIGLFWVIVLKLGVPFSNMGGERSINLIPFLGSFDENGKLNLGEVILNVFIFIPLGLYAGVLFKRWVLGKKILLLFIISLLCETYQLIFRVGVCDITDIVNNTLGGIIGLLIYKGIEKALGDSIKARKFINIVAATGTILMILILFLLKTDRLWIKYH